MIESYWMAAALLWNLVSFVITVSDKAAAKKHRRRVPEKMFLMFALFLGGAGVLVGFYSVRHKTRHYALLIQTWVLSLLSYAALTYVYIHFMN